ncbi:MAG: low-specificity L-threonine aldolase [Pseudomonadota bacterium]
MNRYATVDRDADVALTCDLRSDTVTRPDAGMRAAIAEAEVGDDVFGEDPQVQRLEAAMSERLGKEAGLFVSSGTQGNLTALLSHCARGEEIVVGQGYHVSTYEAAGASVLGGIALSSLTPQADGGLDPSEIAGAVKPDDFHFAITRLLSLENTHDGKAIPLDRIAASVHAARQAGLSVHLDGARYFNAVTELGCADDALSTLADTVSVCLSKGLGAPIGSVLVGPSDLIARARRWRKMLGGGMRQAGVVAAAGLYALEHNVQRLAEDHAKAAALAEALSDFGEVTQATNMVFFTPPDGAHDALRAHMAAHGITMGGGYGAIRLVLHKDVPETAIAQVRQSAEAFFE